MHLPPHPPIVLLLLAASTLTAAARPRDAILLSQVESLTLRGDKQTSHRRVSAIPQLKCISQRAVCAKFAVDLMRCENKGAGYDTEDIQWSCTAQLPPELKLGSTDVICEGYSSPDDPYVLKGSCGVEYRLALTHEGEARWPDLGGSVPNRPSADSVFPILFWVVFGAIVVFILFNMCKNAMDNQGGPNRPPRAARRYIGNGGGGGGGGDWDDPPPPYPGAGGGGSRKSNWGPFGNSGAGGSGGGWGSNLASERLARRPGTMRAVGPEQQL